ncbi:50S ribosomal protein L5 [Patescibacteria group bacterium]|nr:MAG: 50S ribosomal protein L5 [Patescibacteria group bacterium]
MKKTDVAVKTKDKSAFAALKGEFGYKNSLQAPHLVKVVISTGIGKIKDKKKVELIENRLALITGQKAAPRAAKQSIASFKVRKGDPVGYQATLRGARMYDFLDKLVHVALPRTRDFRGLSAKAIDSLGNITIGIKEHTIFPETSDEELKDVFGFAITIVTTAKNEKQAEAFFRHIGIPLQ